MKTLQEAVRWVLHHGKQHGRFLHQPSDKEDWCIGEASDAEASTKSGAFWEIKDSNIRMWEACIDCKSRSRQWIVHQWVHTSVLLSGLDHLEKTKLKHLGGNP